MGATAAALKSTMRASPNDTIRVGVVGTRGRGQDHLRAFTQMENVEVAAVCDVDENVLSTRVKQMFESQDRKAPATYTSVRKMLEDDSIDCVTIATPNHSHTLQAIWAMQAGKHVYVEKPASHNLFESRQIVAAARKYGRICQMGNQSRSSASIQEAIEKLRAGVLGEVYMARGLCFKWRDTIGRKPEEPVPAGVHYDEWLGPAPKRPFTQNRFHYNWHWHWDYGNGDFGNQGVHELDIARWGLGVTYPTKVSAMGGHFLFDDDQETPNCLVVNYEFAGPGGKPVSMVFEVRPWLTNAEGALGGPGGRNGEQIDAVGNLFYGSEGYMSISWYDQYQTFLGRKHEPGPGRRGGGDHYANFIDAVRSGKQETLNGGIEEGVTSCDLMHLGNISYRVGRTLEFDAQQMRVKGDSEASKLFTRDYRKPYVVPENV
jgi:predicted dehydrogenase